MATYPTLGQQSEVESAPGREVTQGLNGTPRIRDYHDAQWYSITVNHPYLTATEKDAVEAFYSANKDVQNVWTDTKTGNVYDVWLTQYPDIVHLKGEWFSAKQMMLGTRQ